MARFREQKKARCHRGNGTRILLPTDGQGIPLSADTTAADHSELTTIETLIDQCPSYGKPRRVLYDKAADADWLRAHSQARGIEWICLHREKRTRPRLQDGRSLRRYERRCRIERPFSWLQNCRRLITRWKFYSELFEGFVH